MKRASRPNLSIICPVYNGEDHVDRIFNNILRATNNLAAAGYLYEVLIIYTDSDDKTYEKILQKNSTLKYKIIHHRGHTTPGSARNTGLDNASGDYIWFIDCDDEFSDDMGTKILRAAIENNLDISGCNYYEVRGRKHVNSKYSYDGAIKTQPILTELYLYDKTSNSLCDKIYSSKLLSDIRFDNSLSIGEDILFNLRAFNLANRALFIDDAEYGYIQHNSSIMHKDINRLKDYLKVVPNIDGRALRKLSKKYPEALKFFELEQICRLVHSVSFSFRTDKKLAIEILNSINKNDIKSIKDNKSFPKSIRMEFSVFYKFGPKVHLRLFPVYNLLRGILR